LVGVSCASSLLIFLVFVFAEIHDSADGWLFGRSHLD
jgi:hypothetical protein